MNAAQQLNNDCSKQISSKSNVQDGLSWISNSNESKIHSLGLNKAKNNPMNAILSVLKNIMCSKDKVDDNSFGEKW